MITISEELSIIKSIRDKWQYYQDIGKVKLFLFNPFIYSILITVLIFAVVSLSVTFRYGEHFFVHTSVIKFTQLWHWAVLIFVVMFIVMSVASIIEWYWAKRRFENLAIIKK